MKIYFKKTVTEPTSSYELISDNDKSISLAGVEQYLEKHQGVNWVGFNVDNTIYWINRTKVMEYVVLGLDRIKELAYTIEVFTAPHAINENSAMDKQVGGDHYKTPIQVVEYIHANNIGYFEGCVIKYVTRWRKKGGIQDLDKAIHYLELLKQLEQEKEVNNADNS